MDERGNRQFVLALARCFAAGLPASELAQRLGPAARQIQAWDAVERLLDRHASAAVAYAVLSQTEVRAACGVPDPTVARLREHYQRAFVRLMLEAPTAQQILDRFAHAGVRALMIKGFAVGVWLYPDPALREHGDIDFLVRERDEPTAHRVLTELGFRRGAAASPFPAMPGESPAGVRYHHQTTDANIDLNFDPMIAFWSRADSAPDPFEAWWQRRQTIALGERRFPTLGVEDQFMQLARHIQKHDYFRINWFIDLMLLLNKQGDRIDWELVGRESALLNANGGIYRTLEILDEVFGVHAPQDAWRCLRPNPAIRVLHRRVWPSSLAGAVDSIGAPRPLTPKVLSPLGPHGLVGIALFVADRNRVRNLTYIGRRAFPSRPWLERAYGSDGKREKGYPWLLLRHWNRLVTHRRTVRTRIHRTES